MPFPKDYMNFKEYRSIIYSKKLFRQTTASLLGNKICFALMCEKKSLPGPKTIGYNIFNSFFIEKDTMSIVSLNEFKEYLIKIHESSSTERVFIKASESKGGKGVYMITLDSSDDEVENLWNNVKRGAYVFQETIMQHEAVNKIYPNSINTVRIETYLNNSGGIEILGGYMRFGAGTSHVDNVSSGGFFVPIDFASGQLRKHGYTALIYGSDFITNHPTTNHPISGFKVPYFFEAIELCKKFANYIPNRIIGWDVAITPTGPLIIEGNHDAAIIAGEYSYGGFKKHNAFKEIMASI